MQFQTKQNNTVEQREKKVEKAERDPGPRQPLPFLGFCFLLKMNSGFRNASYLLKDPPVIPGGDSQVGRGKTALTGRVEHSKTFFPGGNVKNVKDKYSTQNKSIW